MVGGFVYQYAGLRRPIFQLAASQSWDHYAYIVSSTNSAILGELRRRTRAAEVTATWVKPGVRRAMSVTVGAGLERRAYASDPTPLLPALDTGHVFTSPPAVPLLVVSTGWSSVQRPTFSISPEDGTTFGVTARERTKTGPTGKGPASISVVGAATAYKSLDFPGFAHHVLALRGAAGFADVHSEGYFWGGGVSGTPIELVPGYTVGEGRQTFGVRGFPANSIAGVRALGGTLAYRVPLVRAGTGIARLPFYVDRMSLELFGEGAQTWCPSAAAGRLVCTSAALTQRTRIASVGGELDVTTAIFGWDDPYRLRVGYAVPVQNPVGARSSGTVYFAAGLSF
jgi:hypothetical protein